MATRSEDGEQVLHGKVTGDEGGKGSETSPDLSSSTEPPGKASGTVESKRSPEETSPSTEAYVPGEDVNNARSNGFGHDEGDQYKYTGSVDDNDMGNETDGDLGDLGTDVINIIDSIRRASGETLEGKDFISSRKESLSGDENVAKIKNNNKPLQLDVVHAAKMVKCLNVSNGGQTLENMSVGGVLPSKTGYCNKGYIDNEGFGKYLESQGITSLVNENFDEKKTYRLSDNGSDPEMINTVSRRLDLKRKNGVKVSSKFVQGRSRDRGSWGSRGSQSQEKYPPREKLRIIRNLVVVSSAFMLQFTAYFAATNLQSSVNAKAGLGTASLVAVYAGLIISNMFLPVLVIRWLGCKWTMAIAFLTYTPYLLAQFDPQFYTLIPAALLLGLGGGPLWCAKCTYLSVLSEAYSNITGVAKETVFVRFFGFFYVLFPLSQVWGNIISSSVLSSGAEVQVWSNVTEMCGANYCPGVAVGTNPNMDRPSDEKIFTITGIFLACMVVAAILVALGTDTLARYNSNRSSVANGLSGFKLLAVTAKNLADRNQLLLVPITAYLGVSQAFLSADFTESYISCAWGISHIGYVLICYGLCNALSAVFLSSVAVRVLGRLPVVSVALLLYLCLIATLRFWQPNPEQSYLFFVVMVLWGVADSAFLVINAMYGLIFLGNEEAAFSNFRLWESVGFIASYAYSPHLCMDSKLLILLLVLLLSGAGYLTVELTTLTKEPETPMMSKELPGCPEDGMVEISLKQHRAI